MRFVNQITAIAFVSILVSSACSNNSDPSSSPPTTVAHPPAEFVKGPCAKTPNPVPLLENARCGELLVPVNRTKEDSGTLRLAVAIVPSETQPPTKAPIVFLMGGPGQDGVTDPPINPDVPLNRDRDLILMGQRGNVTSSSPLPCPEIFEFFAQRIGMAWNAESTRDAYVEAVKECHDRLAPTVDLSAFNSTESTDDLIDLRKALGLEKWNVFSHSYGTDLALIYMRQDADAIESIVFDGVTPPSVGALGWTWASARQAFDNMVKACEGQPACKERYPDVGATFIRLVNELEAKPITTTVNVEGVGDTKVVVDGGMLLNWFVPVATHLPKEFPSTVDELANGNAQPIASRWAEVWGHPERGALHWGLTLSIWCREWIPFETAEQSMQQAEKEFPELPESVRAQAPQLPFLRDACEVWDVPKAPDSIRDITVSDIPSLVLSGTYDGQTGAVWGDYIAKDLSHSIVAVVPGAAHGVYAEPPCGAEIIASFFDNPEKPDTSCTDTTQLPAYDILPPR
ncbi:alpha/beta hydrolase [Rhodococcus opacus]|uniref:alpha/beta hydrolase n=1 Tax=Rhodococcus opacus TaxID=37919 RepID=UPI0024B9CC88|nr:alpha/beta hydrolase [Rhodococcus opacus]MDJ0418634.1 alpha/beta hydrolase [Rhodococcus opacus]